jgi:predicted transcriptional regulator
MLTKEKVQELINHMPNTFSVDDLVEKIILLQKIEEAQQQIKNGEFYTEEEIDREVDSWLQQ